MSSKKVDRLSNLPEDSTSHILSLMPTKFAVRTSILSKRWRYSWTFVTNLDFDDTDSKCYYKFFSSFLDSDLMDFERHDTPSLCSCSFVNILKFVDWVLEFCRSPQIQLFQLRLLYSCASKSNLFNWIDKAIRLNVCELDIQADIVNLPLNLLTCKTLTKLKLDCYSSWEPSCQRVNLPCLKILHIVVSNDPFVSAFKLINGCPILESLSFKVERCEGEEDYIFNTPTLKRLKLTFQRALVINKVVLHVPILEYLFLGGTLCSVFVMEDVSALTEASFSFHDLEIDYLWVELLKGLKGVKSISAKSSSFTYLEKSFTCTLPIFLNMNRLDLNGYCHYRLVSQFLESSPELQHLCVEKGPSLFVDHGLSTWIEPKLVPACMLTQLTTINLYDGDKSDMEFIEYMLENAQVLKTVTITWRNDLCLEEQMRLAAHLINSARASMHYHKLSMC